MINLSITILKLLIIKKVNNLIKSDLSKVEKLLKNEKESSHIVKNIANCDKTLKFLRKLIKYSRFSLVNLRMNNDLNNNYKSELMKIVNKLENMKMAFSRLNEKNKEAKNEDVNLLKTKIHKLAELYKYLKKGAIHDFIRNQILKRIVNMNLSILSNIDLKKHLSRLVMKKDVFIH